MSSLVKILIIVTGVWIGSVCGNPLFQGISFQRGFEISLKPYQRKPITLFKEKWSPFGVFGSRRTISKRDVDSADQGPVEQPPPVVESNQVEDHSIVAESAPARVIENQEPRPVQAPPLSNIVILPGGRGPLGTPAPQFPQSGLYTNIAQPGSANVFTNVRRPPIVPPVTEPQPSPPANNPVGSNNGSLTSRFASFIGNAFVQFLSQFFSNARLSLSRLGQ